MEKRHDIPVPLLLRYARHCSVGSIGGVAFQEVLLSSSVLVIGAGGLGSPVLLYLAAAGIGRIGICDHDVVDETNLQRQIIHSEETCGMKKVDSASIAIRRINHLCNVETYADGASEENILEIVEKYDVVVDCCDNPETRYLANDACCMLHKPLVSAAAIGTEGQLSVFHFRDGPCYRCVHPEPPAARVRSCDDQGVLGILPGIMGCFQALQTMAVLVNLRKSSFSEMDSAHVENTDRHEDAGKGCYCGESVVEGEQCRAAQNLRALLKDVDMKVASGSMLYFSALDFAFRSFMIRKRNPACHSCGAGRPMAGKLSTPYIDRQLSDVCGGDALLPSEMVPDMESHQTIDCATLNTVLQANPSPPLKRVFLIDVREPHQYAACTLRGALNVPYSNLLDANDPSWNVLQALESSGSCTLFVVCRRGNDSRRAIKLMLDRGLVNVKNVEGGLTAWKHAIDPTFPII
eukprot:ANDGO_06797.mRNA.1 Adenylyltransferase and sulfurtransferase MOCS3